MVARRAARHYRSQETRCQRSGPRRRPRWRRSPPAVGPRALAHGSRLRLRAAPEPSPSRRRLLQLQAARVEITAASWPMRRPASARSGWTRDPLSPPACCPGRSGRSSPGPRGRTPRPRPRASGLADLHEWQSTFGSLDLQSTLVGHGRDLALQGLRLALDDGRPSLAFEWSERARALVSRVAPVRSPADAQVAGDLAELRLLQGEQGRVDPEGPSGRRAAGTVRQRSWYGEGGGAVGEPAGWTRCKPHYRTATPHSSPIWRSTTGWPPSWSPPTTPRWWTWGGRARCGTGSTPSASTSTMAASTGSGRWPPRFGPPSETSSPRRPTSWCGRCCR